MSDKIRPKWEDPQIVEWDDEIDFEEEYEDYRASEQRCVPLGAVIGIGLGFGLASCRPRYGCYPWYYGGCRPWYYDSCRPYYWHYWRKPCFPSPCNPT